MNALANASPGSVSDAGLGERHPHSFFLHFELESV
jgi:hypothetical protein